MLTNILTRLFPIFSSQEIPLEDSDYLPIAISSPQELGEVRGQHHAKEALVIAAAGGHNALMVGPPGEGKSYLASCLPSILPYITGIEWEALRPAYDASNLKIDARTDNRPFRIVGPTITASGLIGGGRSATSIYPGELALAHSGVLFIDELPNFSRQLLDLLRQPLESGEIVISRGGSSLTYPARVMLIAAMNPCPCGYLSQQHSDKSDLCNCTESAIQQYQSKISGPILDRIDLVAYVDSLTNAERFLAPIRGQSEVCRYKVIRARLRQQTRQQKLNCELGAREVFSLPLQSLRFTQQSLGYFKDVTATNRYSTRRVVRLARIIRTIADLQNWSGSDSFHDTGGPPISEQHIEKGISFVHSTLIGD